MPSLHHLQPRDDGTSSHKVLTFAIAIGVTLGLILLVSLSVAFSLIRRRRRAAALAASESSDPNVPDPTFTSTWPVTRPGPSSANPGSPGLTRLLNNTTLSLSRSTHTDEDTVEQDCTADYDLHGLGHGARENAPAGALEPSALMRAPVSRRANPDFVPRFFAPEPEPAPPPPYGGDAGNGAGDVEAQAGPTTGKSKMNLKGLFARKANTSGASSSGTRTPGAGVDVPPVLSSSSMPQPSPPVLPTPCREEPPSYPGNSSVPMPMPITANAAGDSDECELVEPPAFDEPSPALSPASVSGRAPNSSPARASSSSPSVPAVTPSSTFGRPSLTLSIPRRGAPSTDSRRS